MMPLEYAFYWLTLLGAGVGAWSIYLAKGQGPPLRARCGQWLFLAVCLMLGLSAVLAARWRTDGLAGLGLCLGLLVVAMLWEVPASFSRVRSADDLP